MAKPFAQISIPDRSVYTFRVSVLEKKDGFSARMVLTHPSGKKEDFSDADLRKGRQRTLRSPEKSPRTYKGRLTISFAKESHASIRMRIKEPGGKIRKYAETVKGDSKSKVDRTPITLTMKKP